MSRQKFVKEYYQGKASDLPSVLSSIWDAATSRSCIHTPTGRQVSGSNALDIGAITGTLLSQHHLSTGTSLHSRSRVAVHVIIASEITGVGYPKKRFLLVDDVVDWPLNLNLIRESSTNLPINPPSELTKEAAQPGELHLPRQLLRLEFRDLRRELLV